jgi:pentatricopeptide repeat protein
MRELNIIPNLACWTLVIDNLTKSFSTFKVGLQLFEQMKGEHMKPDATCYGALIYNCSIFRDSNRALHYYHEMLKSGIDPSLNTMITLINLLVKVKKFDEANQIASNLQSRFGENHDLTPIIWNTVLRMFALARNIKDAEDTLLRMQQKHIDPILSSHHAMLHMYVETGNSEKAIQYYNNTIMNKNDDKLNHSLKDDPKINCLLLQAFFNTNQIQQAWDLFNELKSKNSLNTIHCNSILEMLSKQGKFDDCMKIVQQMIEHSIPFSSFTYGPLITVCDIINQPEKGVKIFKQAKERNMICESTVYRLLQLCANHKLGSIAIETMFDAAKRGMRLTLLHFTKAIEANIAEGQPLKGLTVCFLLRRRIRISLTQEFVQMLFKVLDTFTLPPTLEKQKQDWKQYTQQSKELVARSVERRHFLNFVHQCVKTLLNNSTSSNSTMTIFNDHEDDIENNQK